MFRQIEVHADDRDYQPLQDFRACTVTYGTAWAPFLALRTLLQLAEHGSQTCPAASNILQHQIYVDDIFIEADSTLQAVDHRD